MNVTDPIFPSSSLPFPHQKSLINPMDSQFKSLAFGLPSLLLFSSSSSSPTLVSTLHFYFLGGGRGRGERGEG
jgi:hypothetical protein